MTKIDPKRIAEVRDMLASRERADEAHCRMIWDDRIADYLDDILDQVVIESEDQGFGKADDEDVRRMADEVAAACGVSVEWKLEEGCDPDEEFPIYHPVWKF